MSQYELFKQEGRAEIAAQTRLFLPASLAHEFA